MISAWNLLWIIPVTVFATLLVMALCSVGSRNEDSAYWYQEGYRDAMKSQSEDIK